MTKQEFIARQKALVARGRKWGIAWCVLFLVLTLGGIAVGDYLDSDTTPACFRIGFGVAFFAFLLGTVPWLLWFFKNQQRQFGLLCPSCGKALGAMGAIVIASGNCGHCGERVLSETSKPPLP